MYEIYIYIIKHNFVLYIILGITLLKNNGQNLPLKCGRFPEVLTCRFPNHKKYHFRVFPNEAAYNIEMSKIIYIIFTFIISYT